jgi:hypothetical protein
MNKFMTAVLVASLAFTGLTQGQTPPTDAPPAQDAKSTPQKFTYDDLGKMLESMGYTIHPQKDKEGKLYGFNIELTRGSQTVTFRISLSPSQEVIWLDMDLMAFNEKEPATPALLLKFFGEHDKLWPAYMVYYANINRLQMSMPLKGPNFTPALIRTTLDSFVDKLQIVKDAYAAVKKEEAKSKDPSPLP